MRSDEGYLRFTNRDGSNYQLNCQFAYKLLISLAVEFNSRIRESLTCIYVCVIMEKSHIFIYYF